MPEESRRDALRRIGSTIAGVAGAGSLGGWMTSRPSADGLITRTIPSSGELLPVIGLGTWQTFDVGSSAVERAPLEEVLAAFVELGGKVIDSSPMYGASEEVVGDISAALDFIQINYSVGERAAERRLLPLARERGVAVIANRPFAGGDLFRRLRSKPLPAWASEIDCDSWAQLLLKFVVSHPAITCAIPGTSKVTHLRDNMKAAVGKLPDEKLRKLIVAEAA